MNPFDLSLTREPPAPTLPRALLHDASQPIPTKLLQVYILHRPGNYVCVDLRPTAKTAAERRADEPRLKLLPKSVGPFRITDTTSHTIKIDEDGIQNVISIDRETPAPRPKTQLPVDHSIPEA